MDYGLTIFDDHTMAQLSTSKNWAGDYTTWEPDFELHHKKIGTGQPGDMVMFANIHQSPNSNYIFGIAYLDDDPTEDVHLLNPYGFEPAWEWKVTGFRFLRDPIKVRDKAIEWAVLDSHYKQSKALFNGDCIIRKPRAAQCVEFWGWIRDEVLKALEEQGI